MSNNPFEDLAKCLELINQQSGTYFQRLVELSEDSDAFSFHSKTMHFLLTAKELSQAVSQDAAIRDMFNDIQRTMRLFAFEGVGVVGGVGRVVAG